MIFWSVAIGGAIALLIIMCRWGWGEGEIFIVLFMWAGGCLLVGTAPTAEERAAKAKPFTTSEPASPGCTLYHYYSRGRDGSPTNYVRCENASTTLIEKKSCGKNCTKEVQTQTESN